MTAAGVVTIAGTFTLGASSTLDGETIMANDSEKTDGKVGGWVITSTKIAGSNIELDDGNDRILITD